MNKCASAVNALLDMLIRISIERTQPLAGVAVTEGGDPLPFEGWLDLRRVVSELVAAGGEDVRVTDSPVQGNEPGS